MKFTNDLLKFIEDNKNNISENVKFINLLDKTFRNLTYIETHADEFKDAKYNSHVEKENKITLIKYVKGTNIDFL